MTAKQTALMHELLNQLPKDQQEVYGQIVEYLAELGYRPQKQRVSNFTLSFKHNIHGKTIGKTRMYKGKGCLSIKFFACTHVPERFLQALYAEAKEAEDAYTRSIPPPDREPMPPNGIMKKCTSSCTVCTGGSMRYFLQCPDGKEIFRCSAYPVLIPNITENDLTDLKRLILEQHQYFLAIA